MHVTYLGHAGFFVETPEAILVMDPWLSPEGAFYSAWYQFPQNHHLGPWLRDRLNASSKPRFVYISHEHSDHFDPAYLATLPRDVTYLIGDFQRSAVKDAVSSLGPSAVLVAKHGEKIEIPGGCVTLYLDDSGLNRDSAILYKAGARSFLNLNDCKLYDELPAIVANQGPVTLFACQFSGATWHPTCYEYPQAEYERISSHKVKSKFEVVARAIQQTKAQVFLPSAGPACFLDPALLHLNFQPVNIFPRSAKLLEFLRTRLPACPTALLDIHPGDSLQAGSATLVEGSGRRYEEERFEPYIRSYAAQVAARFAALQAEVAADPAQVLHGLKDELGRKLDAFTLHARIQVCLYFSLTDSPTGMVRVDFVNRAVEIVASIREADYYAIEAPSWQVARVLKGALTWEQFALTFRMRLNRQPDVYQTLIQGFLLMEPEDLNWFCEKMLEIEGRQKRCIVEAGSTRFSIDRYCPHQGADLAQGWQEEGKLWTCPRHRWQFALDKDGRCLTSDATLHAICLDQD